MERIISYDELPYSIGQSVYLRDDIDPKLYVSLLSRGYRVIDDIRKATASTIYVTRRRQDFVCSSEEEYITNLDNGIQDSLKEDGISKPITSRLSLNDLFEHKYKLPFVLKNENQNCGREKFLIQTEEDYENLINACTLLINKKAILLAQIVHGNTGNISDYKEYLTLNFSVQEYIPTPSKYNTTLRLLTSSSNDLLYGALKYKTPTPYVDNTSLLGYLLREEFPLSSKSIVSNTTKGGKNILIGEGAYPHFEVKLLEAHNIHSDQFIKLVESAKKTHKKFSSELGIICGFDFIYSSEEEKWYLLEYHTKPMVGDYVNRQGINYETAKERIEASNRVRATALALTLKKTK